MCVLKVSEVFLAHFHTAFVRDVYLVSMSHSLEGDGISLGQIPLGCHRGWTSEQCIFHPSVRQCFLTEMLILYILIYSVGATGINVFLCLGFLCNI